MGRVMGFIALAAVAGLATGVVFDRPLFGALVGVGIFVVGLFMLIGPADPKGPEW